MPNNKQEEKKQPDAEEEKVPNSSPAPSVPNEIVSAASLAHDSLDNLFGIPIMATKEFIRLNGSHSSLELVPLSRKPRETESPPKALEQEEVNATTTTPPPTPLTMAEQDIKLFDEFMEKAKNHSN
ncbi:hypothetical protein Ciccas_014491, partial [Cichlidogyrus casuarinus]